MKRWIKLYIEILDDPKMGRLPDRLFRRAIEIFLLAGKNGNDGFLPPIEDMAWILRIADDEMLETLHALEKIGIVHEEEPGTWIVTHFKERQDADTPAERMASHRQKHVTFRNKNVTEPVTNRNVEEDKEEEGEEEKESEGEGEAEKDAHAREIATPPPASDSVFTGFDLVSSSPSAKTQPILNQANAPPAVFEMQPPDVADRIWRGIVKKALVIPPSARDRVIPVIDAALSRHNRNEDETIAEGRMYYEAWCSRRNKDGAYYSPNSLGWLDWWASGVIPEARNGDKESTRRQKMDDLLRKRRELAEKEKRDAQR